MQIKQPEEASAWTVLKFTTIMLNQIFVKQLHRKNESQLSGYLATIVGFR